MASATCSVASASCSVSRIFSKHRSLGQRHNVQTHFGPFPLALSASEQARRPLLIPARRGEYSRWGTQSCRLPRESISGGFPLGFKKSTYFREFLQASMMRSTFATAASGTTNSQAALDLEQYDKERLELDQKARDQMKAQAAATSEGEEKPGAWKWAIRKPVWDKMEKENIAAFPRPVHHRIPNFVGADKAHQLATLPEYVAAACVKVNPDMPQKRVRYLTLTDGKLLLTAQPRLRTGFFSSLNLASIPEGEINTACTSAGVAKYGTPLGLDDKVKVDLLVIGSVAVDPNTGARLGKREVLGVTCLPPSAGKPYQQISSPRPIAAHHATVMRAPPATTSAARSGPMRTSCDSCISTLVVDFDSTCTQHDTTSLYGQLAAEEADARQELEKGAAIRKAWEEAGRMYAKQYHETMTQALPEARRREGFDLPGLTHFLEAMSAMEQGSMDELVRRKLLAGISRSAIAAAVKQGRVPLQPGCLPLLHRCAQEGTTISVLSVNPSQELIRAALELDTWPVGAPCPQIVCNELEEQAGFSTGVMRGGIHTPLHKKACFQDLTAPEASRSAAVGKDASPRSSGLTMYVGDSATDLLPLVAADLGVLLGSSTSTERVCRAFGITLEAVPDFVVKQQGWPVESRQGSGRLLQAQSWGEVERLLHLCRPPVAPPAPLAAAGKSPAGAAPSSLPRSGSTGRATLCTLSAQVKQLTEAAPVVPRMLTIAGSDSGGGAGIQADIKAASALGVYSMSVITALTAQNTLGVQGIHSIPADFVRAQIDSALSDIGCECVKTGMLPSADIIRAVVDSLQQFPWVRLVVDPVMVATSGDVLVGGETLEAFRELLLPRADVITPNLSEAKALLGWTDDITDLEGMRQAARALHEMGPKGVLVKGGHVAGGKLAVDVLFDGQDVHELEAGWVGTRNTHGTGCTLAAAIAAELAKGRPLVAAVSAAKGYLTEALKSSMWLELGQGKHGPLNHFYATTSWGTSQASPRSRFKPSDLAVYAVSDPRMNARWGRTNVEAMRAAIEGGATFLQLREKDSDTGTFVREAQEVVALAREAGVPLVINDRIDVALAVGADGVHIGQSDMPLSLARALLGPDRIIGISTKTPEQACKALEEGADYLGSGGVFPTKTKENNITIGIKGLLEVCESTPLPVVAIGGIKTTNATTVLTAATGKQKGPDGVAIVSGVFDQPDVARATKDLKSIVDGALSQRQAVTAAI